MARFTNPLIFSTGSSDDNSWAVEGGTTGDDAVQPTFDGAPLFNGHWTRIDNLVHFSITVDMDNITDFGEGQYYMKLPYPSLHPITLSDGCLHDISSGKQYSVLAHIDGGSDIMKLFSVASNGQQVEFTNAVPFTLSTEDNFHIAGIYDVDH